VPENTARSWLAWSLAAGGSAALLLFTCAAQLRTAHQASRSLTRATDPQLTARWAATARQARQIGAVAGGLGLLILAAAVYCWHFAPVLADEET
jgi:hypothetical protein